MALVARLRSDQPAAGRSVGKGLGKLKVRDLQLRGGVLHLRIHGKRSKVRFMPAHAAALERINDYLELSGHAYS